MKNTDPKQKEEPKNLRVTREGLRKPKETTNDSGASLAEQGWPPAWSVSFSDMTTLLMCFFILWYSLTVMKYPPELLAIKTTKILFPEFKNKEEMKAFFNAMREKETMKEKETPEKEVKEEIVLTPAKEKYIMMANELRKLIGALEGYLEEEGISDQVSITLSPDEIVITPLNTVLFSKASVNLRPESSKLLDAIVTILKVSKGQVYIEGHTDDTPIGPFTQYRFSSNWELSSARATAVAKHLIEHGMAPQRLRVSGYGPSKPLFPNTTRENRAKNRRVEFRILIEKTQGT